MISTKLHARAEKIRAIRVARAIEVARHMMPCEAASVTAGDGSIRWYREGRLHREDGPALVCPNGTEYWYLNGRKHRADGPAVVYPSGQREWWRDGFKYHLELPDNSHFYYNRDGRRHREDGPAIEHADGARRYFIDGCPCRESDLLIPTLR